MKNWKHFRRFAAMMLVLALAVPCFGALADDSSSYPAAKSETVAALRSNDMREIHPKKTKQQPFRRARSFSFGQSCLPERISI